jgi:hypothetical protein
MKKNILIEGAVKSFLIAERKKAYAESFKKANHDKEMISM